MKKTIVFLILLGLVNSCATGITQAQKRELEGYKTKDLYIEEKNVTLATVLNIFPCALGTFYTGDIALGIGHLVSYSFLLGPIWQPISSYHAATRVNYYRTKEYANDLKRQEIKELEDLMLEDKIDSKMFIIKKRDLENKYDPNA